MKSKFLLVVFVLFAGGSCITQRKCLQKYPPSNDTVKITIVRDSIVFKDTTIFIHLPGEKIIDSIFIPCPEVPGYVPKKVYAETSLAKASAWWSYPNIKLELIQKDTTIERRLDDAIKEAYHWQSEYEKIITTLKPEKYIPQIYKIAFWLWIGVFITIVGYVVLKLFVFKK